jgi:hypothetical protein
MDETHCRALGTYSRPDLEIALSCYQFTNAGARALGGVLGQNRGPTTLTCCGIDQLVLANRLRGNSRLKSLAPYFSRGLLPIAGVVCCY